MRFIQPNCSNARVTIYELLKRRGGARLGSTAEEGGDRNTPRTYDRRADL